MKLHVSPFRRSFMAARFVAVLLAITLLSGAAIAQSGRKIPKRNPPPAAPPEEAKEPPKQEPQAPRMSIMVTAISRDISVSNYYVSAMREGCLRCLKDTALMEVKAGREMNRKEASDAAKASDDYVAWLELDFDSMRNRASRYEDVVINYVVFTPRTGKVHTNGRVYLRPPRGPAGIPLPAPRGSSAYLTESLRQAGEEAAERILDALGIAEPPRRI